METLTKNQEVINNLTSIAERYDFELEVLNSDSKIKTEFLFSSKNSEDTLFEDGTGEFYDEWAERLHNDVIELYPTAELYTNHIESFGGSALIYTID